MQLGRLARPLYNNKSKRIAVAFLLTPLDHEPMWRKQPAETWINSCNSTLMRIAAINKLRPPTYITSPATANKPSNNMNGPAAGPQRMAARQRRNLTFVPATIWISAAATTENHSWHRDWLNANKKRSSSMPLTLTKSPGVAGNNKLTPCVWRIISAIEAMPMAS